MIIKMGCKFTVRELQKTTALLDWILVSSTSRFIRILFYLQFNIIYLHDMSFRMVLNHASEEMFITEKEIRKKKPPIIIYATA